MTSVSGETGEPADDDDTDGMDSVSSSTTPRKKSGRPPKSKGRRAQSQQTVRRNVRTYNKTYYNTKPASHVPSTTMSSSDALLMPTSPLGDDGHKLFASLTMTDGQINEHDRSAPPITSVPPMATNAAEEPSPMDTESGDNSRFTFPNEPATELMEIVPSQLDINIRQKRKSKPSQKAATPSPVPRKKQQFDPDLFEEETEAVLSATPGFYEPARPSNHVVWIDTDEPDLPAWLWEEARNSRCEGDPPFDFIFDDDDNEFKLLDESKDPRREENSVEEDPPFDFVFEDDEETEAIPETRESMLDLGIELIKPNVPKEYEPAEIVDIDVEPGFLAPDDEDDPEWSNP